jgi:hypothetical protein
MQLHLLNRQIKFQVFIWKTLDVTTNIKPNFDFQILKIRVDKKWEKMHLLLIRLRIGISKLFFLLKNSYFSCALVHKKSRVLSLKSRAGDVKN